MALTAIAILANTSPIGTVNATTYKSITNNTAAANSTNSTITNENINNSSPVSTASSSSSPVSSSLSSSFAPTTTTNTSLASEAQSAVQNLTSAFGSPFYILNDSEFTGNEVLSLEPQKTKDTYMANGFMQGIGNVKEEGTYVSTYKPDKIISTGIGFIIKDNHRATFTAEDTGKIDSQGNIFLKGTMYFESGDPIMSSINGHIGLYLYYKDQNGTDWTKTWLWK